jgi:hypothetical protein
MARNPWVLAAIVLAGSTVQGGNPVESTPVWPRGGSYEIVTRLELPHLERWAVDRTNLICLSSNGATSEIPVPVLSANNPFRRCAAANVWSDGAILQYDIVCAGRDAARAHATYTLTADGFNGRVAMIMGGKNMTMTEVQRAKRIGDCGSPMRDSLARF